MPRIAKAHLDGAPAAITFDYAPDTFAAANVTVHWARGRARRGRDRRGGEIIALVGIAASLAHVPISCLAAGDQDDL